VSYLVARAMCQRAWDSIKGALPNRVFGSLRCGFAGLALLLCLVFAASASATTSGNFKTPSGNIVCAYLYGRNVQRASVLCGIKSGLKPAPPRNGPGCKVLDYQGDRVGLEVTGHPSAIPCSGDAGPYAGESSARTLGYGKTWSGGIRCTSAVTGLTCRNKSGHGFFLTRAHWRKF
jgi:hypothetical protein